MVVSPGRARSIFLSTEWKPEAVIESLTLFLSLGRSIVLPVISLPSITIFAASAAASGVISTVSLIVLPAGAGVPAAVAATGAGPGLGPGPTAAGIFVPLAAVARAERLPAGG